MDKTALRNLLQEVYSCDVNALPAQLARMTPMIRQDVCNKLGIADKTAQIGVELGKRKVHAGTVGA